MSLASASVRRPVFTSMVTLIVVILGAVSLGRLQIDLLPSVELPTLTVATDYEGASPEVMERLVTQIVEEVVATVPGVEELTSYSSEGSSSVHVQMTWGTDLDAAVQDVRARLEDEMNEFPEGITRPRIHKFDVNSSPVVILGVSSALDPVELTSLVENQVRQRFTKLPGVAQVDPWGGYPREVRVELDLAKIKALRLPLDDVLDAIRSANLDLPAGRIEQGRYEVTLRAPSEFTSIEDIRATVVAVREGAAVTVGDIAEVRDTYQRLERLVRINGDPGVRVAVRKQPGANTVEVAAAILEEIKRVNRDFPQLAVVPVSNQGNFIELSIANVTDSVLWGSVLSILVLLVFLRNIRSTVVIALSIPISIIATFALVYFGGFTLNLMTLGGLALGVGQMVDSSIVVLENIFRRRDEEDEGPIESAINGAAEVGPAIFASTITQLVIFLPLVFVRGVTGILFKELAYVIAFSLVCSLLVSLTLVPVLAVKLLRSPKELRATRPRWIDRLATKGDAWFDKLDNAYRDLVVWSIGHRLVVVAGSLAALAASLLLWPYIGSEFLPPSDEGQVRVSGEMELGTRLDLVDRQTRLMEEIVFPAVPETIASEVNVSGGSGGGASGSISLSIGPVTQRTRSNQEVADDLRERLEGRIPGMTVRTRAPQGQAGLGWLMGGGGDESLTVEVRGFELHALDALAAQVAKAIEDVEGITDVDTNDEEGVPQQTLRIDRDKAADLGLSVRDVAQAMETAVAGMRAGDYRAEGNAYRILVQLRDVENLALEDILDLTLTNDRGGVVALRNVVSTEPSRGPMSIERKDQQRLVRVRANISGRPVGTVAEEVEARLRTIAKPVGYDFLLAGSYEEQRESFNELLVSLVLALVLVYMALACQYESLRDPLVVMLSVPFAAIGVLLTLFLTKTTLNVQSYIGCIMLGGIVVNNAILLVDQAGQLKGTMGVREAVAEAGRRRLRPILMTTLASILGLIPLAIGIGEGSEAQAPLARAVLGGLTASTLVTLVFIPVMYTLFHPERRSAA